MDISNFYSSFESVGLGLSIAGSALLYNFYRDKNTFLLALGFILIFASQMIIKYCLGLYLLSLDSDASSFLCVPVMPYIKAIGFTCVGIGLVLHAQRVKKIH